MSDETAQIESTLQIRGGLRALSDLGLQFDAGLRVTQQDSPSPSSSNQDDFTLGCRLLSARSSVSDALEGVSLLPSRLSSLGEEAFAAISDEAPQLNVDSIHSFIGSPRYHTEGGVPRPNILAHVSGTGLAPWEIHRPQKFVRDLVLRRCFSGRVLDAGCGIGDNALYVAKACPAAVVTAVDVVPRCLEFAAAKAGLRGMRGKVKLEVGDLLQLDPDRLPPALGIGQEGTYDVILDSLTFHCFSDTARDCYVSTLRRLLRPGGIIFMNCMSEEETRPGGPRRISVPDLLSVFNRPQGWEVETIEDCVIEFHPTFWNGRAQARLFAIRKLPACQDLAKASPVAS